VLEGSVRRAGNRVRITGQLIDVADAVHIWADRFDSHIEDVFELQDRVTESVVGTIGLKRGEPTANLSTVYGAMICCCEASP
jgi:TolB-like protein